MAARLNADERRRLAATALELSSIGVSNMKIAERLGVNRKTVTSLIELAGEEEAVDEPLEVAKARFHYRRIISSCWARLNDGALSANSHNVPALISQAAKAQARLDRLNGIEAPQKIEHSEKMSFVEYAKTIDVEMHPNDRLRVVDPERLEIEEAR